MKVKMNKTHDQIEGKEYSNSIWIPIYKLKFKGEKKFVVF